MNKLLLSFFLLGLSFGIGPCLSSCGPLLISYIAGREKNITKSIGVYFLFSLSRIFIYLVLGLSIFLFGQDMLKYALGSFSKYIFILGGLFIIAIGLLVILGKNSAHKFCQKVQDLFLKKDAKTIIGFGLIVGISPCAPFISTVSYIGLMAKHWLDSLVYSLAFGLGTLLSPLLFLAGFTGLIPRFLEGKKELYDKIFSFVSGLIIIFLGLQLIKRAF